MKFEMLRAETELVEPGSQISRGPCDTFHWGKHGRFSVSSVIMHHQTLTNREVVETYFPAPTKSKQKWPQFDWNFSREPVCEEAKPLGGSKRSHHMRP